MNVRVRSTHTPLDSTQHQKTMKGFFLSFIFIKLSAAQKKDINPIVVTFWWVYGGKVSFCKFMVEKRCIWKKVIDFFTLCRQWFLGWPLSWPFRFLCRRAWFRLRRGRRACSRQRSPPKGRRRRRSGTSPGAGDHRWRRRAATKTVINISGH